VNTLNRILFEAAWLGGAGAGVWFFPKTALVIVALSAAATMALRMVEKSFE
jgi:CubicO group peptidase (beta-lactamase class C family)